MKTSKISGVIAKVAVCKNEFKIHLQDNCVFFIPKDAYTANFNPYRGLTLVLGFYCGILAELTVNGQVIFSKNIDDLLVELQNLQKKFVEDAKKKAFYQELSLHKAIISELPAIMQHRILLLQTKLGREYRHNYESSELRSMQLAVALHEKHWNEDLDNFINMIPCKRNEYFNGAAQMSYMETMFAFTILEAYRKDIHMNAAEADFEKSYNFLEYSKIMEARNVNYPQISLEDINNYCLTKKKK